jgi:hypothetical protein
MLKSQSLKAALLAAIVTMAASVAHAQATRTWVSGVGDDANPCSRTAPCKTFGGAISRTAAGGEIDVIDPGGFGGVTITKSVKIDGTPVTAGALVAGTDGIVINAAATDTVVLRGLTINGTNTAGAFRGIRLMSAKQLVIEDCDIYQFGLRAISIEPTANNTQVFIHNTRVFNNLSNGIVVAPTQGVQAHVTLDNVQVTENVNFGMSITAGGTVVARNSTFADNGLGNVRVDGTGSVATLDLDTVAMTGSPAAGLIAVTGATARINNVLISNNGMGISFAGGTVLSTGNNRITGNTGGNGPVSGSVVLQ